MGDFPDMNAARLTITFNMKLYGTWCVWTVGQIPRDSGAIKWAPEP